MCNPTQNQTANDDHINDWELENDPDLKDSFLYSFPTGIEEFDAYEPGALNNLPNFQIHCTFQSILTIDQINKK